MAGLLDQHLLAGDDLAFTTVLDMADWAVARVDVGPTTMTVRCLSCRNDVVRIDTANFRRKFAHVQPCMLCDRRSSVSMALPAGTRHWKRSAHFEP